MRGTIFCSNLHYDFCAPCRFSQKPPSRTPATILNKPPNITKKTTGTRASTKNRQHKKIHTHHEKQTQTDPPQKKHATKMLQPTPQKNSHNPKNTEPQKRHNNILHKHTPQTQTHTVKNTPRHPTKDTQQQHNQPARHAADRHNKQQKNRGHKTHTGAATTHPHPQQNKQRKNETKTKRTPNQPVKKFDKFN